MAPGRHPLRGRVEDHRKIRNRGKRMSDVSAFYVKRMDPAQRSNQRRIGAVRKRPRRRRSLELISLLP
jgi:hypothetical protein